VYFYELVGSATKGISVAVLVQIPEVIVYFVADLAGVLTHQERTGGADGFEHVAAEV
jgi:hypothetical protein